MRPLTKRQAVVVSAFTGVLICEMSDLHEAIEQKLGRPIWTHELADKAVWDEIKAAFREEFLALRPDGEDEGDA